MMNGLEERETVLTLADSSSEVKERKVSEGVTSMVNFTTNSNSLAPAAIIISSNEKHPGDHHHTMGSDTTATFLTSSQASLGVAGEQGNFQVIGVAAGEGGEQILVITPLSTPQQPQPSQTSNVPAPQTTHHQDPATQQPLIINGFHFQAAPSTVSSSEQLNDSAILAAQFELIKQTCPTLSCDDEQESKPESVSLSQEPDTVTLHQAPAERHQDMSGDDNVVVLYQGKQSSNLDSVIESVAAEASTTATNATDSGSASLYNQELAQLEFEEDIVPNETFRKCVVCLRKRPITRDIFDLNNVLNQSMAVFFSYLHIDPRNENKNDVGICPPCLDHLLNWHAFSTSIRSRHEAVRSWPAVSYDNIPVNDTAVKSRLFINPKKTGDLKKYYWSQSGQHSYLVRRYLTDSDWDWICEYLEKHPPPQEKEKVLVQTYLHSREKLTHIFCIYCRHLIENGKKGYVAHMKKDHPSETDIRFPCELCGMLNTDDGDAYFTHWISHLFSEKCEKCDERFPNAKVMRQHLLQRHQPKPKRNKPKKKPKTKHIECPHCNVCLSTNSSLKKHIDYKHYEGPLKHTCSLCEKQFRWRYLLIRHERNVHRLKTSLNPNEDESQMEGIKSGGDEDTSASMQSDSMIRDVEKVLQRSNYSPDINPEAHSNGYPGTGTEGNVNFQGEIEMQNGLATQVSQDSMDTTAQQSNGSAVPSSVGEGVTSSSSSTSNLTMMGSEAQSQFSSVASTSTQETSDTSTSSNNGIGTNNNDSPSATNLIVVNE